MKNMQSILGRFDEIEISQKIGVLFILNKVYLDKDLDAERFARKIGVPSRFISPLFSTLYGHRFKELTNMYRVEYAKNQIEEGGLVQDSLAVIAQKSGFTSQSSFVQMFTREEGMSPTEYSKIERIKGK
jgi:AraC-like DNA-binding protein